MYHWTYQCNVIDIMQSVSFIPANRSTLYWSTSLWESLALIITCLPGLIHSLGNFTQALLTQVPYNDYMHVMYSMRVRTNVNVCLHVYLSVNVCTRWPCPLWMISVISSFGQVSIFVPFKSFSYLHDRTAVRSGAEIGLLTLRLSVFQGVLLRCFLLAPACPINKVTIWNKWGFCERQSFLPKLGIEPGTPVPKPSAQSTRFILDSY